MSIAIRSWNAGEVNALRALARHPSLQREFELLQGRGLDERLADAYNLESLRRLATLDGRDAGFAFTFVVPTLDGLLAVVRIGVVAEARRRGVGRALLESSVEGLRSAAPECRLVSLGATLPNDGAGAFADRMGFLPVRRFWLMERRDHSIPPPEWPSGTSVEPFRGRRELSRWVDVFNRSWREHWHGVLAREADFSRQLESGAVSADGMHFARAGDADVGFVRLTLHESRGEIAVVGVIPEWRRRGLGQALLRFGGRWLLDHGARRVTLTVDGENERALSLYRKERYEVVETRQVWERGI